MATIPYHKLRVLVADDFSNFRSTVNRMLLDLGVVNVDMASNSEEILELCSRKRFDVVLCDYNLGAGRNGQHVLEELRYRGFLGPRSVFILVSAEAGRNIVMSAYDSAPDDYLMKPITTRMLYNRLGRLLALKHALEPVYQALDRHDHASAMDTLIDMSLAEDRHSTAAQKMLGELFLQQGEYAKAENLYKRVLEVRELDWARLGLAKAKHLQGDFDQAGQWLNKIVEDNYLYLPAYDVLADNCLAKGDSRAAQEVVQRSVDVSPMSILRQKNLASLATRNHDPATALEAMRKVVKLGRLSCYGGEEDGREFARSLAALLEEGEVPPIAIVNEAFSSLESLAENNTELLPEQRAQLLYIQCRVRAARGERDVAGELLVQAELGVTVEDSDIDTEVDHIRALLCLGYEQKASELLERLQELYADDQEALERLDEFLDEPASEANKAIVAEVNREGIELYGQGRFSEALACFDRAVQLFPKHIGLRLNIVQALVGKLKAQPEDDEALRLCRESLETVAAGIEEDNAQYKRFLQLKNMARALHESA